MNDAINAVLADVKTSLGTVPLFTDQGKLNRAKPNPPYALLLPVSEPTDPNGYDSAAIFGLNVWGPLAAVLKARQALEWLRRHEVGKHGTSQNLRYSLWTRTFQREPETVMPDGVTEVWNLSTTYRCQYANFAPYAGVGP